MGDRIAVLRDGRMEQVGPPLDLYDHPMTAFVGRFLGTPPMNILPSNLLPADRRLAPAFGIRPELLHLVERSGDITATVTLVEQVGGATVVHLSVDGAEILVRSETRAVPAPGAEVGVSFRDEDLRFFDSEDGAAVTGR